MRVVTNCKHNKKRTKMANTKARAESFVWTDDEVELLLRVTLDYKITKLQDNVDWESCQSKYGDIMDAFLSQYPTKDMAGKKDFPHDVQSITKVQVSSKIKSIRGKYRQAVHTGRRNNQGRVVLLFYELCEEIWGRSQATTTISAGIETGDLADDVGDTMSTSSTRAASPAVELDLPEEPEDSKQTRELLQAKLNCHRKETLKKKLPADPTALEDLKIRRRMLEIMEQSDRRNAENMQQINANVANLTQTIQETLSLMKDFLQQQQTRIELKLL